MDKIIEYGVFFLALMLGLYFFGLIKEKASLLKKILFGIAILIFIVVTQFLQAYLTNEYRQNNLKNSTQEAAKSVIAKIENSVANDTSNRTDSEKLYDATQDMISEKLAEKTDGSSNEDDKVFAAGVFAGQYGRNVVVTYEYCKTLGINLTVFTSTYKKMHKNEYMKAESIFKRNGTSVKEAYLSNIKLISKYVEKEIADIRVMFVNATGDNSFELADSCGYYNEVALDPEVMESVRFSNVAPEAYSVLMN